MKERYQRIFVKRFYGFAVLFRAERRCEQFANQTFRDDVDGGAAGKLAAVVTTKTIGDNEDALGRA